MSYHNTPVSDVKARKRHLCTWCGTKIQAGEVYKKWVCIGDDGPCTAKMHKECHAAMERYAAKEQGDWEYDPYSFTRGCTCEGGDRGHGHYADCCTVAVPAYVEPT